MLPKLPSSIVAVAYTFIITVLAGVQFRRSRTPLRLGSFVMALFGLSIAALSVVYAADKMEMSIFWVYQFVAECIAVTWVITTIIHLGYAFYPLTRHQTLIWRVALGSVVLYDLVAIAELSYYVYAVWGAGVLTKSSTPVHWVYWARQVVKVTTCVVTILYLFVPLVRHHHSAGVAQIADSNTLAVGTWYLGALGIISLGYSTMLIYYICNPGSAFTSQAQSLDLCLRLLVCPVFSLPPPTCLLRYFHDKYGSAAHDTDNPNTMVEAGITNDPRPHRPPMLVSQPASFTSNRLHRNSDYMLESPSDYSYRPSSLPAPLPLPQPHVPSLHEQHLQQQQHLQHPRRYSVSDYVPAFALKDSKLGAVHLDAFHSHNHGASSSDEGRRRGGETRPSSMNDSVAGSTALSTAGDAPNNGSETGLTPTTIATLPSEPSSSSSGVPIPSSLAAPKVESTKNTAEHVPSKLSRQDHPSPLPSPSTSLSPITSLHQLPSPPPPQQQQQQELLPPSPQPQPQPQQQQQYLRPQQQELLQSEVEEQQQQGVEATVLSLSIPQPLVNPTLMTPSEPPVMLTFDEGYTSPSTVDQKHEEAKQTAQAARRISRRLTMEGRREGMDLLHITSLIKWNNPAPLDSNYHHHHTLTTSRSRDRLQDIPIGWPRTTSTGSSSSSSKPSTPLRELIPPIHKIGSFFAISKSPPVHSPPAGTLGLRRDSATLTEQREEEEREEVIGAAAAVEASHGDWDHGDHSGRARTSSDTADTTNHSHSPAMTTASIMTATTTATTTMEPAHSRDRLRRSQSLTRVNSTLSPSSLTSVLVSPHAPKDATSLASPSQENSVGNVSGSMPLTCPELLSIPTVQHTTTENGVQVKNDNRPGSGEEGVVTSPAATAPATSDRL